MPLLEQEFLTR